MKQQGLSEKEFRAFLFLRIKMAGSQKILAKELGMSCGNLNDVIKNRRPVSANFAKALGFQQVVSYYPLRK